MTNRSSEQRYQDAVDRIIAELPINDGHKELIREFLGGIPIEAGNAQEARVFVDEWVRVLAGAAQITTLSKNYVSTILGSARLSHDLLFPEAILHRLSDDPAAAVSIIDARDEERSTQNARNAAQSREAAQDWWSLRIGDCMEDNIDASPSDVKAYLLEIDGVSFRNGKFIYDGPETHRGDRIQTISMDQLRSKRRAALERIKKFGSVS